MANNNCLEGMACPQCGSEGPFLIAVHHLVRVHDDGTEEPQHGSDYEWNDTDYCACEACDHKSTVGKFRRKDPNGDRFKVWVQVERINDAQNIYEDVSEAVDVRCYLDLAQAEAFQNLLIRIAEALP